MATVKHKPVGLELDKAEFESEALHELSVDSILVVSKPPSGMYRVVGLYVNPSTGRFVVRYDDTPVK